MKCVVIDSNRLNGLQTQTQCAADRTFTYRITHNSKQTLVNGHTHSISRVCDEEEVEENEKEEVRCKLMMVWATKCLFIYFFFEYDDIYF